jgi:hypothetical protein
MNNPLNDVNTARGCTSNTYNLPVFAGNASGTAALAAAQNGAAANDNGDAPDENPEDKVSSS